MKTSTYQERQRPDGKWEATVDGTTWHRLLPMSFTAENAQKVHDGSKTQTRRLMNPQPDNPHQPWSYKGIARGSRYRVGDVLWVQEPWWTSCDDNIKPTMLPSDAPVFPAVTNPPPDCRKLRPGRFLPLRFARPARYEVTAVRLERVNEISGNDIWAEGMTKAEYERAPGDFAWWRNLWNSIHTEPGTRFEDAPWVFAYTFRRVR